MKVFFVIIGVIAFALGIKMIYDARPLVKQYFGFGSENEAALGLKILGFFIAVFGGILLYFNF